MLKAITVIVSVSIASMTAITIANKIPDENVTSITLGTEDIALDLAQESISVGELVCVDYLPDKDMYWVYSCKKPIYRNGDNVTIIEGYTYTN